MIDLHTHSRCSDGAYAPAEVVRMAAERGVRTMALSDHDTLAGIGEAREAGARLGVRIIPATELNTESEWGDVHILGYFVEAADRRLGERLQELRDHRGRRIERMVENLNRLGYPVSLARVHEIAAGGALGRPHLAQALHEAGHVATYDEAFETLIAKGAPAYVEHGGQTPLEAVRLIRDHGGAAVLAHPFTAVDLERLLPVLIAEGLAGIEAHYGEHTGEQRARCLELARTFDLVPTGGSDFHGRGGHGVALGGVFVPAESVMALESRLPSRHVEGAI